MKPEANSRYSDANRRGGANHERRCRCPAARVRTAICRRLCGDSGRNELAATLALYLRRCFTTQATSGRRYFPLTSNATLRVPSWPLVQMYSQ